MTEIPRDSPMPEFVPPEVADFLRNELAEFDTGQSPEERIGSTALRPLVEATADFEDEFVSYMYSDLVNYLDLDIAVWNKRYHPTHELNRLRRSDLYGQMLITGSLVPHQDEELPEAQQPYARYCELLAQYVTETLPLLGYTNLDDVIQRLRGYIPGLTSERPGL
jgi:hypothetical protein